jgi:hypothetical protein
MLEVAVHDDRLRPALSALQDGTVKVLTLDCFDTLLWRTVPEPIDAFVLLGHRLAQGGMLPSHLSPGGFARLRQRAEQRQRDRAVERGESFEIGLHSIWQGFPEVLFGGRSIDEYVSSEVELERSILISKSRTWHDSRSSISVPDWS